MEKEKRMTHSFYLDDAMKYGMQEAVILKNISHWVEVNRANERHFHDGRYWTFNSVKAFCELFPYLSRRQIERILNKLVDCGALVKGNYNQHKYDKTSWYTTSDMISPNGGKDFTETCKGNHQTVEPIPDINTDVNTDIKHSCEEKEPKNKINYELVKENWNNFVKNNSLPKILNITSSRREKIKKRMSESGFDFQKILDEIAVSDLLLGKKGTWSVKFDWIFENDSNYTKILEGNYRNKGAVVDKLAPPPSKFIEIPEEKELTQEEKDEAKSRFAQLRKNIGENING